MYTGKLNYVNEQWVISYEHQMGPNCSQLKRILVNPEKVETSFQEGDITSFEIVGGFAQLKGAPKTSNHSMIKNEVEIKTHETYPTWSEILFEMEEKLHVELPIRAKNWLKNKFNPPTQKSIHEREIH